MNIHLVICVKYATNTHLRQAKHTCIGSIQNSVEYLNPIMAVVAHVKYVHLLRVPATVDGICIYGTG